MANNLTVTYKGNTIHTASSSGSATLKTGGAWCEGDIGLSYTFEASSQLKIIVHTLTDSIVTANDGTNTYIGTETATGDYEIPIPNYGTYIITVTHEGASIHQSFNVIGAEIDIPFADPVLENNSWSMIQTVSNSNAGANIWSIGDTKAITFGGTIGTLTVNSTQLYCYIIGFDHNSSIEGDGITFGTFKTTATNGVDICFITNYASTTLGGTKNFSMNHYIEHAMGGWKACDLRYDILGSTSTQPSGYGALSLSSKTGYDAVASTPISPVPNTFMSCLPLDLRTALKPITKYTCNTTNPSSSTTLSASIDYLPLLSEYELQGVRTNSSSSNEGSYQAQYQYYISGNSKAKHPHNSPTGNAHWWLRSPASTSKAFCKVLSDGAPNATSAKYSYGIAPIFKV